MTGGHLFEDYKLTRVMTLPVMLASKMAIGVIVGATYLPDRASSMRQIAALMLVFGFLFCYMLCYRPHVEFSNFTLFRVNVRGRASHIEPGF